MMLKPNEISKQLLLNDLIKVEIGIYGRAQPTIAALLVNTE